MSVYLCFFSLVNLDVKTNRNGSLLHVFVAVKRASYSAWTAAFVAVWQDKSKLGIKNHFDALLFYSSTSKRNIQVIQIEKVIFYFLRFQGQ